MRRGIAFASLVVPSAILVHLSADAAALGRGALTIHFLVRHIYLGVLLLATIGTFAAQTGFGHSPRERRRRCALLNAEIHSVLGQSGILVLLATNVGFFALTQAVEGVPIALGSFALGALVGAIGSIAAALLVFFFGRSLIGAALEAIVGDVLHVAVVVRSSRSALVAIPRAAAVAYSLFVPNRPPPALSLRPLFTH